MSPAKDVLDGRDLPADGTKSKAYQDLPADGTKSKKESAIVERDLENIKTFLSKEHEIVLTVRLESCHPGRRRYLVVVSATPPAEDCGMRYEQSSLEYCLLGIDISATSQITLGLVVKMLWGTKTSLDGDGGFSLHQVGQHYIFKPVSVQALWTAIQTLNMVSASITPKRNSLGDVDWDWVKLYKDNTTSPQSCINEWHTMPDLLVRRPPTPGEMTLMTDDEANAEMKKTLIKSKLRDIMKTVDLDEITSKSIRAQLETDLDQNLEGFKSFIDEEILLILGQMDPASKMFDFLYLGSEWNASNLEELNGNGITHILNVTREIDNFFPAIFQYLNIREYDEEQTDLLKYWNKTYNFINDAKEVGGNVLVHCKMGISRSASTVVAFAMKFFSWTLDDTLAYVRQRRPIVNPNKGFRHQLQVYEGILEASRHRNTYRKLYRSKSESSLKFSVSNEDDEKPNVERRSKSLKVKKVKHKFLTVPEVRPRVEQLEGVEQSLLDAPTLHRPKSWSPPSKLANYLLAAAGNQDQPAACQTIRGCDKSSSDETQEPIVCHCYSQLARYYSHNLRHLPHENCQDCPGKSETVENVSGGEERCGGDWREGVVVGDFLDQLQSEKHPVEDSRELRRETKDLKDENCKSTKCPAKTHIKQCTCNFELELNVLDEPVNILEEEHSVETDVILKNLGNFPIHIRQSQQWNNSSTATSSPDEDLTNFPVIDSTHFVTLPPSDSTLPPLPLYHSALPPSDSQERLIGDNDSVIHEANNEDCAIKTVLLVDTEDDEEDDLREELSVKTLADMFDYRIGDLPAKPPRTKNVQKLRDAKIDEIAKKLTTNSSDCSEC